MERKGHQYFTPRGGDSEGYQANQKDKISRSKPGGWKKETDEK